MLGRAVLASQGPADPDYAALMDRRAAHRIYVVLTTFVVVTLAWAFAAPDAQASVLNRAPVCDPRGAITFAPPPQMQDPTQSLDVVTNDDDCSESPLDKKHVVPSRAPRGEGGPPAQEPALSEPLTLLTGDLAGQRLAVPTPEDSFARPGYRVDFERPPRA